MLKRWHVCGEMANGRPATSTGSSPLVCPITYLTLALNLDPYFQVFMVSSMDMHSGPWEICTSARFTAFVPGH